MLKIRNTEKSDIELLKNVVDSSELFPSEMLEEMMSNYLKDPESEELWYTCLLNDIIIGFAYCVPEKLTEGTFNILAIGVLKEFQGKGIGRSIITHIEEQLKDLGKRIIIIETSSEDSYQKTRKFYEGLNYRLEATIHDFWSEGDDKLVYWKKIN
jgi:ribosomal protein S18 acetylase RimI-like enzyme